MKSLRVKRGVKDSMAMVKKNNPPGESVLRAGCPFKIRQRMT